LNCDNVEMLNERLVGPDMLRDFGLLDSAVMRPQASAFGDDAYPTIHEKAAALLHGLARNHPFVDGNKRTAWAATSSCTTSTVMSCRLTTAPLWPWWWMSPEGLGPTVPGVRRLDGHARLRSRMRLRGECFGAVSSVPDRVRPGPRGVTVDGTKSTSLRARQAGEVIASEMRAKDLMMPEGGSGLRSLPVPPRLCWRPCASAGGAGPATTTAAPPTPTTSEQPGPESPPAEPTEIEEEPHHLGGGAGGGMG